MKLPFLTKTGFRNWLLALSSVLLVQSLANAQDNSWPKTINVNDGSVIKIYQPAPESLSNNVLKSKSVISLLLPDSTEPIFGTFWAVQNVETDHSNNTINIISAKVPNLKFSGDVDPSTVNYIKTTLETNIPNVESTLPLDDVTASLAATSQERKLSKDIDNNPPSVIYSSEPSILVSIDGEPKLQHNDDWNLDVVANTPFTIVKNNDGNFYLYGGKHWYTGLSAEGPYTAATNVPSNLSQVQNSVDNANNADPGFSSDSAAATEPATIPKVIVSTVPAELIQTSGQPAFTPIDGTNLSYVNNSQNDIFLSKGDQQYYVLISGRWYKAPNLNGPWQYTASNALPADFAKIPAGSPKDNVLASVAGTNEAREAVMDAQLPQTAKVDRNTATADVSYDGNPQFQNIEGTDMQYAVNTPNSVIMANGNYYCVDNGVWFVSNSPSGPWVVCTHRPDEVDLIPPSCPAYNIKYVYIYDVEPDWVYTGYTPGYLNAYVYGPTVVYGTGFYYRPWRGRHFYARPYTWGFSMCYNPWYGWSLGYDYGFSWFNIGFGYSAWPGHWGGGWWGPSIYRPAFRENPYRHYGYYGYHNGFRGGFGNRPAYGARPGFAGRPAINMQRNNIYNFRRDVISRNNNFATRPAAGNNNFNGGRQNNMQQQAGRPQSTYRGNNSVQQNRPAQQQGAPSFGGQQRTQNYQPSHQGSGGGGGGFHGGGNGGGHSGGGGRRR